jgi:hypothetical protein
VFSSRRLLALRFSRFLVAIVVCVFGSNAPLIATDSPSLGSTYDAPAPVYDGALHSAHAHTSEAAPGASRDGFESRWESVATATGVSSVLSRLSVAANTGPRFVAAVDGTIIDTQAPALAQQIKGVVGSLRTTGKPPRRGVSGGLQGSEGRICQPRGRSTAAADRLLHRKRCLARCPWDRANCHRSTAGRGVVFAGSLRDV